MSNSTVEYSAAYLDEYIGWRLKAIAISFLILDCGFVAVRFFARHLQRRPFGLDDSLMIAALVFCLATQACAFVAVNDGGVGRHVQYATQHYDLIRVWYQTCMIAAPVLYMFSAALPKIAILWLFLQIFRDKLSRWGTWATIAAIVCNIIVMVPLLVDNCRPISYGWKLLLDPELKDGRCANVEHRLQFANLANIVTDVSMLLLPIPTLYKLQIDKGTKFGLVATFGMALAGLATSCLRFAAFFETSAYNDATWSSVTLVGWCIIEPGIYMFVACQMTFRPLFVAFFRTHVGTAIAKSLPHYIYRVQTDNASSQSGSDHDKKLLSLPGRLSRSIRRSLLPSSVADEPHDPSAPPPMVYNGNIWVRHEYRVQSFAYSTHSRPNSMFPASAFPTALPPYDPT